jgi:hypothetical protein
MFRYIRLEYRSTNSITEAAKLLATEDFEFVEGIMFGLNKFVVMHGTPVDRANNKQVKCKGRRKLSRCQLPPILILNALIRFYCKTIISTDTMSIQIQINSVNSWYKPWFYKHVERFLDKPGGHIEYIPTRDYYHRHQRSYFWEISVAMPYGNSPILRYFFGWIYPANFQLRKLLSPQSLTNLLFTKNHVLQDFMVPMSQFAATVKMVHQEVEVDTVPCTMYSYISGFFLALLRTTTYLSLHRLRSIPSGSAPGSTSTTQEWYTPLDLMMKCSLILGFTERRLKSRHMTLKGRQRSLKDSVLKTKGKTI